MNDLQHLQKVILSIAKDIDDLCRKNNIDYYLFGGSALGAIRHQGFIPWDDDMDIIMDHHNYTKFIKACREQLDPEKYYVQEALVDWPMLYSKIRLKGTYFEEPGAYGNDIEKRGIFLDIFKLDNAPSSEIKKRWQYICSKYALCYCLLQRGYKEAGILKKLLIYLAYPLKNRKIRDYLMNQLVKYNQSDTDDFAVFGARFRYEATYCKKGIYGKPLYVPFDDCTLPVPQKYDELLTQLYGDYMTPPPPEKRVGWHLQNVDFGKY